MKKVLTIIITAAILAGCAYGGEQYHQNKLDRLHNAGISALEATVNLDDYRKKQQKKIRKILDKAEAEIMECEYQPEVDKIVSKTPARFAKIKTDAQLTAEEEEARRKAEEERRRQEELERQRQAEIVYQNWLAQQARSKSSRSSHKSNRSNKKEGCIGNDPDNFN